VKIFYASDTSTGICMIYDGCLRVAFRCRMGWW